MTDLRQAANHCLANSVASPNSWMKLREVRNLHRPAWDVLVKDSNTTRRGKVLFTVIIVDRNEYA